MAYRRPNPADSSAPAPSQATTIDVQATPAPAPVSASQAAPAPAASPRKQGKPNPFLMEHFTGDATRVSVMRKAHKDADQLEPFAVLEVVKGKFGTFLSTPVGVEPAYRVSTKREITGHISKSPVAYMSWVKPGTTEKQYISFFKQMSEKGECYMRGRADSGEIYLLFVDKPKQ